MSGNSLSIFVTFAALLAVIVIAWLSLRAFSRLSSATKQRGAIQLLETRYLGPKEKLMVVSFRSSDYLIGVSGQAITLLDRLPQNDAVTSNTAFSKEEQATVGETLMG